jgi:hypothetical protein
LQIRKPRGVFERGPAHFVLVLKAPQHSKAHVQEFEMQAFTDGCLWSGLNGCDDRFFFHSNDSLTGGNLLCDFDVYAARMPVEKGGN